MPAARPAPGRACAADRRRRAGGARATRHQRRGGRQRAARRNSGLSPSSVASSPASRTWCPTTSAGIPQRMQQVAQEALFRRRRRGRRRGRADRCRNRDRGDSGHSRRARSAPPPARRRCRRHRGAGFRDRCRRRSGAAPRRRRRRSCRARWHAARPRDPSQRDNRTSNREAAESSSGILAGAALQIDGPRPARRRPERAPGGRTRLSIPQSE